MTEVSNDSKRKRGIQASPVKLRKALVDAGIKTQAELANKIADLEGLDNPPRGLVNKIFRGQAVDLVSLERVARALAVESWRLYLNGEEQGGLQDTLAGQMPDAQWTDPDQSNNKFLAKPHTYAIATCTIVVGVVIVFLLQIQGTVRPVAHPSPFPVWRTLTPNFDQYSLIITAEDEFLLPVVRQLNHLFAADSYRVGSDLGAALLIDKKPYELARQYDAELILTLKQERAGRNHGLKVFLYADDHEELIWAEHQTNAMFASAKDRIALRVKAAVEHALGIREKPDGLAFPTEKALWEFINGLVFLDKSYSGFETKDAQAHFYAAIRQYPDYAEAHAALCEALAHESWQGDIVLELKDASRYCERALALKPNSIEVKNRYAWLQLASGRPDKALESFNNNLAEDPNNAETLRMLGQAQVIAYTQSSDESLLEKAYQTNRLAITADPGFWKPYLTLGNIHFFSGDIDLAIEAYEEVVARESYITGFVNLANMYLCKGRLAEAKENFTEIIALDPKSYLGYEMIATYYYLTGDFEFAILNMETAIDNTKKNANQSAMWTVLGDAYRLSGDKVNAAFAYEKAVEVIQNDILMGFDLSAQHLGLERLIKHLHNINPDKYKPTELPESQIDSFAETSNGPSVNILIAQLYLMFGDNGKALHHFDLARESCLVYDHHPDMQVLKSMDETTYIK